MKTASWILLAAVTGAGTALSSLIQLAVVAVGLALGAGRLQRS